MYLLPGPFKKIGWIIFGVMLLLFVWVIVADALDVAMSMPLWLYDSVYTILPVGFSISLLLIAFSKEDVEDEYIMKIRGDSLIWAVVFNYAIVIVGSLVVYGLDYLYFMMCCMFTIPFIYLVKFKLALCKLRKSAHYEEQA
jgi:hypothetical protein